MRTAVVCALLCAATLLGPSAAASAPQAPPPAVSVSVAVTDGVNDTEAGKRLDYRITVHNLGPTDVHRARIEQEMPATTTSATAPGGTVEGRGTGEQKVIWRSDLPAHDIQVFTATAVLGDRTDLTTTAAPGSMRAAATVCVYVGGSFAPTACSGDLDDLPETHPERGGGDGWVWWAVGAVAVALLGPGVVRAVRRRAAARH
ncbi:MULTISPECIES: DUF11 domain-containing protein [Streptomyces]|uniref:DUF11 domain-containing protein n=1 Tax=Streptomyces auratus AGR0001 TaxID=1160718 RepID=J2K1A6_9ACTN|nr:DUF11 domain-containing protein [Streptomyces auratus]QTZ92910.1 hypothetical protein SU9_016680 [Streptomyces auratus AGR0001]